MSHKGIILPRKVEILFQGRSDNNGEFVKSQAHIKFGATEGQVLRE